MWPCWCFHIYLKDSLFKSDHFDKYLLQPSKFPEEIPQGSLRHHGGHNLMESRRQILFKSLVQTEKCPRSGIWRPFSCAYVKVFIITCQIIYPQNTRLGTLFGFIAGTLGLFLGALIKEGCKKFSAPILHIQGVPLPTRPWPPKTGVCPVSVPQLSQQPNKAFRLGVTTKVNISFWRTFQHFCFGNIGSFLKQEKPLPFSS